jgi:hypothetical protein
LSFWGKLARVGGFAAGFIPGIGPVASKAIDAAASGLGEFADTSAANRGAQVDAASQAELINQSRQRDFRTAAEAREKDRRESGTDAWRKMQQAEYVGGGGNDYAGHKGRRFGFGPKGATTTERAAASEVLAEAQKRIAARDSLLAPVNDPGAFRHDPRLLKPRKLEKIASVGSAIGGAIGAATNPSDGLTPESMEILERILAGYGITKEKE